MSLRRDPYIVILIFAVLGPPLGTFALLWDVYLGAVRGVVPITNLLYTTSTLPIGYLYGEVPAVLSGSAFVLLMHFIPSLRAHWTSRSIASACIGGLITLAYARYAGLDLSIGYYGAVAAAVLGALSTVLVSSPSN